MDKKKYNSLVLSIIVSLLILLTILVSCYTLLNKKPVVLLEGSYKIIGAIDGSTKVTNKEYIKNAPDSIKAILAYYSSETELNCINKKEGLVCDLSTALGLGNQCSERQANLVKTWLGKDINADGCYSVPDGATHSSRYSSLKLDIKGDKVVVDYAWSSVSGMSEYCTGGGQDIYQVFPKKVELILERPTKTICEENSIFAE